MPEPGQGQSFLCYDMRTMQAALGEREHFVLGGPVDVGAA